MAGTSAFEIVIGKPMVKILYFMDHNVRGRGATVRFATGESCTLSIARTGIIVKKSRYGFFGAILYAEKVVHKNAICAIALAYLLPEKRFPAGVSNPVLCAFFNAILHCNSAAEASTILNEAITLAERKAGCPVDEIPASELPPWAVPTF